MLNLNTLNIACKSNITGRSSAVTKNTDLAYIYLLYLKRIYSTYKPVFIVTAEEDPQIEMSHIVGFICMFTVFN